MKTEEKQRNHLSGEGFVFGGGGRWSVVGGGGGGERRQVSTGTVRSGQRVPQLQGTTSRVKLDRVGSGSGGGGVHRE